MQRLFIAIIIIACSSCDSESFKCKCTNGDTEITSYDIEADTKESASFECKQKELTFSGNPEYQNAKCTLQ